MAPGDYTVRLTVDGAAFTQPLIVRMDPRVQASPAEIQDQTALAVRLWDGINRAADGIERGGANADALTRLSGNLTRLMQVVDDVDRAPTSPVREAAIEALAELDRLVGPPRGRDSQAGGR